MLLSLARESQTDWDWPFHYLKPVVFSLPGAPGRLNRGAAYVFVCTPSTGSCEASPRLEVDAVDPVGGAEFGGAVAISADGNTLVVGASGKVYNTSNLTAALPSTLPTPGASPGRIRFRAMSRVLRGSARPVVDAVET